MSAATSEQRYTLPEAEAELKRQQCAERGHAPDHFAKLLGRIGGTAEAPIRPCHCGEFEWLARPAGGRS